MQLLEPSGGVEAVKRGWLDDDLYDEPGRGVIKAYITRVISDTHLACKNYWAGVCETPSPLAPPPPPSTTLHHPLNDSQWC